MGKRGEGWTLAGLHYAIGQPLICYVSILSTAQPLLLNILSPSHDFPPTPFYTLFPVNASPPSPFPNPPIIPF